MEDISESYVDCDALAHCNYPVPSSNAEQEADCGEPAAYRVWWTYEDGTDDGEMDVCFHHWQRVMRVEERGNLHALEQRAANNALARLALLLDAIETAHEAAAMEEDGVEVGAKSSIASHLKYKTPTVTKLAAMAGLPDGCIDLELPVGTYWVAIQHCDGPEATIAFLKQQAIPEQMSPAQAKRALGVTVVRESRLAKLEAELERWRALVPSVELLERLVRHVEVVLPSGAREVRDLIARIKEARRNGP